MGSWGLMMLKMPGVSSVMAFFLHRGRGGKGVAIDCFVFFRQTLGGQIGNSSAPAVSGEKEQKLILRKGSQAAFQLLHHLIPGQGEALVMVSFTDAEIAPPLGAAGGALNDNGYQGFVCARQLFAAEGIGHLVFGLFFFRAIVIEMYLLKAQTGQGIGQFLPLVLGIGSGRKGHGGLGQALLVLGRRLGKPAILPGKGSLGRCSRSGLDGHLDFPRFTLRPGRGGDEGCRQKQCQQKTKNPFSFHSHSSLLFLTV